MLELAIRAGIPLIVARTDDLLNLEEVLQAISPLPVAQYKKAPVVPSETLCYVANTAGHPISYLYESFAKRDSVLLVVNPDDPISEAFDAGIIPTPTKLVKKHLSAIVSEEEMAPLMRCLSGLTLKQIVELVKLTQARFGDLLPKNILTMRGRLMGGLQGLAQVELRDELYCPPQQLVDWLDLNAKYFLDPTDPRLTPRGILMAGPPGVGKTVGAKHIAKQLDVPLYRLDLAGALGRFVGESEANLTRVLNTVDQEAPAILLIDEIEKLFKEREDSGVTSRLLSQLLWWLQEHQSRVLVVMTTNDVEALPKELYRAGRIDTTITIEKLSNKEIHQFAVQVLSSFPSLKDATSAKAFTHIKTRFNHPSMPEKMSHAEVVSAVFQVIKERQWL